MSKAAAVGMPILYFPAGTAVPMQGTVAGVEADGRVNIAFTDSQGSPRSRQGVPFDDKPNPGGDYVVANFSGDSTAAIAAHAAAMKAGFQGVPTTGNVAKGSKESPAPVGDFTSAALMPGNAQAAGSGGPFDPANTAKAQMSAHQTLESQSEGRPTTGGMTPKINAESAHLLSERDREVLAQMQQAKSGDEKARLANAGTGIVTPGSVATILAAQKADRADPMSPRPGTPEADAPAPTRTFGFNAEATRIEREQKANKEAIEKSNEITAQRKKDSKATAKVAAKTPTQKHKPAAKAAKKPPTKAAKKSAR